MTDLLLFLPACFALNLTFGPNNLTAMTHGAQYGVRFAALASIGRLLVFVPMIAASALGLGVLLTASASAFTALKVVGAAYLVWIGYKLLRSSSSISISGTENVSPDIARGFRREGLVALSNPKAILIFAAIFPQFVDTSDYWRSYITHGTIFLLLEMVAIILYAGIGHAAATRAAQHMQWFQRASGVGMIFFGVLLSLSRHPSTA